MTPENIPLTVLYEDDHMLVIDKQAGLVVHPGHGNWSGTLVNALMYHFGQQPKRVGEMDARPGLVHRLDKNTSGVMVIGKTEEGKPTGWADMDPRFYTARSDDRVYFVGDLMGAISPQFGYYPKSGHVANAIGKIVARNISERVAGKEVVARLPDNLCYMMVNGDPQEEIAVKFEYEVDKASGHVHQTQIDIDVRTTEMVKEDFAWIKGRFDDFLF